MRSTNKYCRAVFYLVVEVAVVVSNVCVQRGAWMFTSKAVIEMLSALSQDGTCTAHVACCVLQPRAGPSQTSDRVDLPVWHHPVKRPHPPYMYHGHISEPVRFT